MNPINSLTESMQMLSVSDFTSKPLQKITRVHFDDVHALMPFGDGSFASGSKDTTIRIWDANLELLTTLEPSYEKTYANWITSLHCLGDGRWVSGSRNGSLSFWSKSYKCLGQKNYHPPDNTAICKQRNLVRINCLAELPSASNNLVLAGLPKRLETWAFSSVRRLDTFVISNNDWLYCIKPFGNHQFALVIGSDIEVWENRELSNNQQTFKKVTDLYKERQDEIIGKQRPHISACEFMNRSHLIMTQFSGHVKLLDVESGDIVHSFKEHQGRAWTVCPLAENFVASGADDHLLKIWDLRIKKSVYTLGPHSGRVSCVLKHNVHQVLAASCPGNPFSSTEKASFTVWDLRL